MAYEIKLEQYQGPLDVLLQLIEQDELTITDISLSDITDAFIDYVNKVEEMFPEELADFLVVATRLLYLKSRALLPYLFTEDDEPATSLADHLKMYKEFRDAADRLTERLALQQYAYPRPQSQAKLDIVEFMPPHGVEKHHLQQWYEGVLDRLDTVIKIPQAAIRKAITLKDKIMALQAVIKQHKQIQFSSLVSDTSDRLNIVLTFLAVLELVKQDSVSVEQNQTYSDILIVSK